jgi:hypothetical protein
VNHIRKNVGEQQSDIRGFLELCDRRLGKKKSSQRRAKAEDIENEGTQDREGIERDSLDTTPLDSFVEGDMQ